MDVIIFNTVCLPIKTGPSFTGYIRAIYLQKNGYNVTLAYPFLLNKIDQLSIYSKLYEPNEFIQYLRSTYDIPDTIKITLYDVYYNHVLRWQCIISHETLHKGLFFQKNKYTLIIEDPEPFLFSPFYKYIALLLKRFYKVVCISHTQYTNITIRTVDILPFTIGMQLTSSECFQAYLNLPNFYCLYISEALFTEKKCVRNDRMSISRIHGINDKYFIDTIQTNNAVYYIGKLDMVHKNLPLMRDCIKNANLQIAVFGDGKDKDFILSNSHEFIYKGLTSDIRDLDDYGIYVSFSDLEGLCTATAEAIAMNKRCIILNCECNDWFRTYKNVYYFTNKHDFVDVFAHVQRQPVYIDANKNDFRWSVCNKQLLDELHRFGI